MHLTSLIDKQPSDSCLLCGGLPAVVGIFKPDNPTRWGASEGKARFFRYCLCESCNIKSDKAERVEKIIRHQLVGGGIIHAE